MRCLQITLVAVVIGCCGGSALKPSAGIVISNLKSHVLGSSLEVCGSGPALTLTVFTFDFAVEGGIDISAGTSVYRILPSTASDEGEVLGQVAYCSSGPCSTPRRACITAGRSTGSGTIEIAATEEPRQESSWTIEVRQKGGSGARSNALTTVVSYRAQ